MTVDYERPIQYLFGALTLAFAFMGLAGTYVSSLWATIATPPERPPGMFMTGSSTVSLHLAHEANRRLFYFKSLSLARLSNLVLFGSVVAGLTINFPWLWAAATLMLSFTLAAGVVQAVAGSREAAAARLAFEQRRTAHAEKYGGEVPDGAALKKPD